MRGKKQQRGVNGLVWEHMEDARAYLEHLTCGAYLLQQEFFPPAALKCHTFKPIFFYLLKLSKPSVVPRGYGSGVGSLVPGRRRTTRCNAVLPQAGRAACRSVGRTRKEARATRRSLVKHDSPLLGLSQSRGLINIYSFRLGERALHAH